jgi:hypothetical protein
LVFYLEYLSSQKASIPKKIGFNTNKPIQVQIPFQNLFAILKYEINKAIRKIGGIIIKITHRPDIHET